MTYQRSAAIDAAHGQGYSATSPTEAWVAKGNRLFKRDQSLLGIAFFHGAGVDAESAMAGTTKFAHVAALRGFQVVATDAGANAANSYTPMTNDDVINVKGGESITFLKSSRFGVRQDKVIIAGNSQGSAQALILAAALGPAAVAAVVLTLLAADIEDIRANNRGGLQAAIEAAYGGNAAWQAKRATRNPIELAANAWAGIPVKAWCSSTDDVCTPARTDAFSARTGIPVEYFDGGGHTTTGLDSDAVVDWTMQQIAA